jgi:erythromycin esterase-like protein
VDAAIAALGYWTWNTQAFRRALDKLRDYNRTASPGLQIDIVGIDIQNTEGAVTDLTEVDAALPPAALALLAGLKDRRGAAWRDVAPSERDATRNMLGAVAARRDSGGLASPVNRHALSARALLRRLELVDASDFWTKERVRDAGMARMVEDVLDVQPGARATLWAHLGHLARELVVGAPPLGSHLAAALGDSYRAYALLAYSGAARGRSLDGDHAVVVHPLPAAPGYSLEGALAHAMQRPASLIAYTTFDHPGTPRMRWLRELHWIRSFGATYPGDQKSFELYDLAAIDGAVLFDTVTPTEPLAATSPPARSSP